MKYMCQQCEKEFEDCKSHPRQFCSTKCYDLSRQTREIVICQYCGVEFEACINETRKFCSRSCANKSQPTPYTTLVCEYCKKEFSIKTNKSKNRKYCSTECRGKSSQTLKDVTCLNCNTIFHQHTMDSKFCSPECSNEYRKGKSINLAERIRICEYCGNKFEVRSVNKPTKYCSNTCMGKAMSGEHHPMWRGGITPKYETIRLSDEYRAFRLKVLERDLFICQRCGNNTPNELRVHHIKSFSRFPGLRFDVDNGITLCETCHYEFHHLYGKLRFTSDDLYEFQQNINYNSEQLL